MMEEEGSVWEPRTATERFVDSLVNDTPPHEDTLPTKEDLTAGWIYRGVKIIHEQPAKPDKSYSVYRAPKMVDGLVVEMPLQGAPWPTWRERLDRQSKELRQRLNTPDVAMLVVRGRTYSARGIFRVLWLYLMTKLFGLPKRPKEKKPKNAKKEQYRS